MDSLRSNYSVIYGKDRMYLPGTIIILGFAILFLGSVQRSQFALLCLMLTKHYKHNYD